MKKYNVIVIFNKEITDIDKLFGFKIMNREQAKTFMKAVKRLENEASEFEICGDYYEYSYSDFDIQSISQTDLKVLSKIFEFDYDPSSGDSPTVGAFPNAIEQLYDEHPDIYDDENNEDDYEEEY